MAAAPTVMQDRVPQQPQKLSRYRSLRAQAPQVSTPQPSPPVPPPSSMAAAAASASLQRSQSRYRRPAKPTSHPPPPVPTSSQQQQQQQQQQQTQASAPRTASVPRSQTFPQAVSQSHNSPAPARPRHQTSQPNVRQSVQAGQYDRNHPPLAVRTQQGAHRSPPPSGSDPQSPVEQQQQHLDRPKHAAHAARADARHILEQDRRRQRQLSERLQAEREAARIEYERVKEQRAREALERAAEMDRMREAARLEALRLAEERAHQPVMSKEEKEELRQTARAEMSRVQRERAEEALREQTRQAEIRREALKLQAEQDKRMQQAREVREAEEAAQDERIRVLARARYEEQLSEWQRKVAEQKAKDEKTRQEMAAKRAQHRQELEEKERKKEQKERKLAERESQKNLRAAMGPHAAVGGTGGAPGVIGVSSSSSPAEDKIRTFPSLRRRQSDRPSPKQRNSVEAFTGVFRRRSDLAAQKATVGTRFEDTKEREQPVFVKHSVPKPGGAGVDAPISASNAGERVSLTGTFYMDKKLTSVKQRVMVQCGKSSMYLPITPTTTPVDLIFSASNVMSEDINPKASVLQEHFSKVGVQRPLRNYEHVRDVLNSWDDDKQNVLVLVPSPTGGSDAELEASTVVNLEPPGDQSFFMHYSQKPGKWDKRYITLRTDGQVVHSKKDSSKDFTPICHMSDFDIYTPMDAPKKIASPKKHCFGVKSQQKSAMFLSTENFVHFFASSDRATASAWYSAVQGWRSWYLVNVMGEGQASHLQPTSGASGLHLDAQTAFAQGDKRDNHYQIGSFKPLLDLGEFGGTAEGDADRKEAQNGEPLIASAQNAGTSHQRTQSSAQRQTSSPPSAFRNPSVDQTTRSRTTSSSSSQNYGRLSASADDAAFTATGLLGRTYSRRQRDAEAAAASRADASGPFTEGPSLLNDMEATLLARSATTKGASVSGREGQPKPLVDLTAEVMPSSGRSRGKAFVPDTSTAQHGLVDSATGPNQGVGRSKSTRRGPAAPAAAPPRLEAPETGVFAADGLLASVPYSQGGHTTGRGVGSGAQDSGKPLLDLGNLSLFAGGSLLRQAEQDGRLRADGPVIERQKGVEVRVATGEAS